MHIQTHVMSGFCVGDLVPLSAKERFFCMLAASLPDLDGITYILGQNAYWETHHVYGHNLLFALILSGILTLFSAHRIRCFLLYFLLVHLHFAMDLLGSGEGWTIPYFWPFHGMELSISAWDFDSWQNKAAGLVFLLWCLGIAVFRKRTIFEWIMPGLDRQLAAYFSKLDFRTRTPKDEKGFERN